MLIFQNRYCDFGKELQYSGTSTFTDTSNFWNQYQYITDFVITVVGYYKANLLALECSDTDITVVQTQVPVLVPIPVMPIFSGAAY